MMCLHHVFLREFDFLFISWYFWRFCLQTDLVCASFGLLRLRDPFARPRFQDNSLTGALTVCYLTWSP